MKFDIRRMFATRTLAISTIASVAAGGALGARADARIPGSWHCRAATPTLLHRSMPNFAQQGGPATWAVYRVSVGGDGLVRIKPRLLWHAGDAGFGGKSASAVTATAFTPASHLCRAAASTFDYAMIVAPQGGYALRILPAFSPALVPNVRVAEAKGR